MFDSQRRLFKFIKYSLHIINKSPYFSKTYLNCVSFYHFSSISRMISNAYNQNNKQKYQISRERKRNHHYPSYDLHKKVWYCINYYQIFKNVQKSDEKSVTRDNQWQTIRQRDNWNEIVLVSGNSIRRLHSRPSSEKMNFGQKLRTKQWEKHTKNKFHDTTVFLREYRVSNIITVGARGFGLFKFFFCSIGAHGKNILYTEPKLNKE